jgi:hypothetical protein
VRACRLPSRLRLRLRARRGGGRLGVRVAAVAVGSARLAGVVGPDVLLGSWTDLCAPLQLGLGRETSDRPLATN